MALPPGAKNQRTGVGRYKHSERVCSAPLWKVSPVPADACVYLKRCRRDGELETEKEAEDRETERGRRSY